MSSAPRTRLSVNTTRSRHRVRPLAAAVVSLLAAGALVGTVGVTSAAAATTSTLAKGKRLAPGAALVAPDGRTRLTMQTDGNLVLRSPSAALWTSRTAGRPGAALNLQTDGNLVLRDAQGVARWTSGTRDVATLTVQSDGNLVARTAGGVARWTTGTTYPAKPPTTTPSPNSAGPWKSADKRFGAGMQSDGNLVLRFAGSATPDVLWSSRTNGHPKAALAVQSDGNLVIRESGRVLWSSGTAGHPGAVPSMTRDGNFVVASSSAGVIWQTNTAGAAAGLDPASADRRFTKTWTHILGASGSAAALGSPGVGTLDSRGTAVLFGTRAGGLNAFHTSDGSTVPGWPVSTAGVAVDSTPAVAGSGAGARVYVGTGTSSSPRAGGISAWTAAGKGLWAVRPNAVPTGGGTVGVMSSVAVGNLQTGLDIIGGAMGQMGYAIGSGGGALRGFPWFQADTNFSTPALADLTGDGRDEAIMGGDSSPGLAFGRNYVAGGHIRIVKNTGAAGASSPAKALVCEHDTNQVVQSSPAVGRFLSGGGVGIAVGTGTYWAGASDTNAVFAMDARCSVKWRAVLDGASVASPSLIDVDGNGTLEVVTASSHGTTGTVYVLDGATGRVRSATAVSGRVYGQVTSVDIAGRRSLLVGHTGGVTVLDGATGYVTGQLAPGVGVQNTPAVTLDPGGKISVTIIGYNFKGRGVAMHFQLNGAKASTVTGAGQWPMFHRDSRLRGSTLG